MIIDLLEIYFFTANDRMPESASYSSDQFIQSKLQWNPMKIFFINHISSKTEFPTQYWTFVVFTERINKISKMNTRLIRASKMDSKKVYYYRFCRHFLIYRICCFYLYFISWGSWVLSWFSGVMLSIRSHFCCRCIDQCKSHRCWIFQFSYSHMGRAMLEGTGAYLMILVKHKHIWR